MAEAIVSLILIGSLLLLAGGVVAFYQYMGEEPEARSDDWIGENGMRRR